MPTMPETRFVAIPFQAPGPRLSVCGGCLVATGSNGSFAVGEDMRDSSGRAGGKGKAAGAEAPAARKEPHDGYARTPCDDLTVWFIASDFAAVMNAR